MSAPLRSERSPPSLSPAPTRPLSAWSLVPVLGLAGSGRSRGGCGLGRAGWAGPGRAGPGLAGGGRFPHGSRYSPAGARDWAGGTGRTALLAGAVSPRSPPFLNTARVLSAAEILISAANKCNRFFLFFSPSPPFLHLIPT